MKKWRPGLIKDWKQVRVGRAAAEEAETDWADVVRGSLENLIH